MQLRKQLRKALRRQQAGGKPANQPVAQSPAKPVSPFAGRVDIRMVK